MGLTELTAMRQIFRRWNGVLDCFPSPLYFGMTDTAILKAVVSCDTLSSRPSTHKAAFAMAADVPSQGVIRAKIFDTVVVSKNADESVYARHG